MINLADHIAGFRRENYLPFGLRWIYANDPARQEDMEAIDLRETDPDEVVKEAQLLARVIMPADADGFVVELGGLGVHEERRA